MYFTNQELEVFMERRRAPIGTDNFRRIREDNDFYVDKSLMIKEFIARRDEVALITRPRRFGKTLNMTMIREFFDITMDSRKLFEGLAIMDTEFGTQINSRPIICFTFKDCLGRTLDDLRLSLVKELMKEYRRYDVVFRKAQIQGSEEMETFYRNHRLLKDESVSFAELRYFLGDLLQAVHEHFQVLPILLLDEYDQPILSSYENGYREELADFFAVLYGYALKGNPHLGQALLTGIQRVAKESIFSKLNNLAVYTVVQKEYSAYFGLTEQETSHLLEYYGRKLDDAVRLKYDGYRIGDYKMYTPWSLLNYARSGELDSYWINTSTNYLIRQSLLEADEAFLYKFDQLISEGVATVGISLATSLMELKTNSTLWGLLVNAGYITVDKKIENEYMRVRIPNDEVKSEFEKIVAARASIQDDDLKEMLYSLVYGDMAGFRSVYKKIVLSCTSHFDSKENAYHMLFLGMCIFLRNRYEVTSNIESGHGRHDIRLKALKLGYTHIIVEFKQGKDIETLKEEALEQIFEREYYAGLSGKVLCIGIAHDKKRCEMAYREIKQ